MGTNRTFDFDFSCAVTSAGTSGICFFYQTQLGGSQANTHAQTRAAQKATTV
jgi:hypothetical protein